MRTITVTENLPQRNWPSGRRPSWVDERTRLYSGVRVRAAGSDWETLLAHFDGKATTLYLTKNGFDVQYHGPAVHIVRGDSAAYRKVVREFFRDYFRDAEVRFA